MHSEHDAGKGARKLHLDLGTPRFESIIPQHHDDWAPDDDGACNGMHEEEVHTVVGPSISLAQTRMASTQTPAAEKSAAILEFGAIGVFDGVAKDRSAGQHSENQHAPLLSDVKDLEEEPQELSTSSEEDNAPPSGSCKESRSPSSAHRASVSGPFSALADLNVKRYMSGLCIPRVPLLSRTLPLPSLSIVLSNTRNQSPVRRGSKKKRASTLVQPGTTARPGTETSNAKKEDSANHTFSHDLGRRRAQSQATALNNGVSPAPTSRPRSSGRVENRQLKRATSDQSLYLHRALSAVPSLGDDSRWENVQEQVNSRVKALKDSFQDSSIKLPSISSLPSFSLNPFRPDTVKGHSGNDAATLSEVLSNADGNNSGKVLLDSIDRGSTVTNGHESARKASRETEPYLDRALGRLTGDLVVLGGYRGSILRSSKPPHRQLWIPVKVGLNIRKVNLEVGLEPEDEVNMEKTIFPSGMLSHIGPVDMGRRLLKRLQNCSNVEKGKLRVHDYGYDWRLSPALNGRKLVEFLESLPSNQSDTPAKRKGALVIAHSMGGLITRYAVNQRPELFAGVLYAGTPQHCVNILGPFRNGDDVLLSSRVLTAQVNFSMRSSFVLLPDDGRCFVDKNTKEEYLVDFFNPETWREFALSPCIASVQPPAAYPERKGILGSLSESLPLPTRRSIASVSTSDRKSSINGTAESAAHKVGNLTEPTSSAIPTLEPPASKTAKTSPATSSNSSSTVTLPLSQTWPYLTRTLRETLQFRQSLHHNPSHQSQNLYPPHSLIYATNTPTVSRARVTSRAAIACADAYDDLQFGSGDGVVLARAAQIPEGYHVARGGRVKSERGHVGLLGDLEAVGKCLCAVLGDRRKGVGLGLGLGSEQGRET